MAQNTHNKDQPKKAQNSTAVVRKGTPMIVERVNGIPMVNMALSIGFSQYDKLKSSNVTVGQVMTRAENLAAFLWTKLQPLVEKLQEPLNKADQLACNTLDYVEGKLRAH